MSNLGDSNTPISGDLFGLPSGWTLTENNDGEAVFEDTQGNVALRRDATNNKWVTDEIDASSASLGQLTDGDGNTITGFVGQNLFIDGQTLAAASQGATYQETEPTPGDKGNFWARPLGPQEASGLALEWADESLLDDPARDLTIVADADFVGGRGQNADKVWAYSASGDTKWSNSGWAAGDNPTTFAANSNYAVAGMGGADDNVGSVVAFDAATGSTVFEQSIATNDSSSYTNLAADGGLIAVGNFGESSTGEPAVQVFNDGSGVRLRISDGTDWRDLL